MSFAKVILREWESKVDTGIPDIQNEQHFRQLVQVLVDYNLSETFIQEFVGNLLDGPKQPVYEYMVRDIDGPMYYKRKQGTTLWSIISENEVPSGVTIIKEEKPLDKMLTWTDEKGEKKSGTARSVIQTLSLIHI